jgi:biofilm protein TabA
MAILGTVSEVAKTLAHDARFTAAFAYLSQCLTDGSVERKRLLAMAVPVVEKVWLADQSLAMEQTYTTRARRDCFFESHRQHIDVQCAITGEEWIDVVSIQELTVSEPYLEAKDLIKYKDSVFASRFRLMPGYAAVFFPEDGHMPGQSIDGPLLMRKTVVKVPVTDLKN